MYPCIKIHIKSIIPPSDSYPDLEPVVRNILVSVSLDGSESVRCAQQDMCIVVLE